MTDILWPIALFGTVFWLAMFVLTVRRWTRQGSGATKIERERWEMYAGERHYTYMPDPRGPKIRGVHRGASFELIATITQRRGNRRQTTEHATAMLRATHRAALPHGFQIRKASWGLTLGSALLWRFAMDTDDAYRKLRVECDDEDAADPLLDDPAIKSAVLALFIDLPKAVIHERAIECELPKLPTDLTGLDTWLDRISAVAIALRAKAPQVEKPTVEGKPPPLKPLPTVAELPERKENLSAALRRISQASSRASAGVQGSSMRLRPYEYEVEVRVIDQATSRLGVPTGGRLVRGQLARSPWRVEISFGPGDNDAVDKLRPTDVITGLALVDELRAVTQTVSCTAETPPVVVQAAKARSDGAKS